MTDEYLQGKVAFITGVARGQGRSHAIELAKRGVKVFGLDICDQIDTVPYGMGTPEEMDDTVSAVQSVGGAITAIKADVRHREQVDEAVRQCTQTYGLPDIVLANAGISPQRVDEPDFQKVFQDVLDVNVTGVWNTVHAVAPAMIERGTGGAIVITSSAQGLIGRGGDGSGGATAYTAAKHACVGLMRSFMMWLSPHEIRVNTVHPTGVATPMVMHEHMAEWATFRPDVAATMGNVMNVEMVDPIDVTRAILYLVGDSGRWVTGVTLPVDGGFTAK